MQFAQTNPQSKNCKRACNGSSKREEKEIIKNALARLTKKTVDYLTNWTNMDSMRPVDTVVAEKKENKKHDPTTKAKKICWQTR